MNQYNFCCFQLCFLKFSFDVLSVNWLFQTTHALVSKSQLIFFYCLAVIISIDVFWQYVLHDQKSLLYRLVMDWHLLISTVNCQLNFSNFCAEFLSIEWLSDILCQSTEFLNISKSQLIFSSCPSINIFLYVAC